MGGGRLPLPSTGIRTRVHRVAGSHQADQARRARAALKKRVLFISVYFYSDLDERLSLGQARTPPCSDKFSLSSK